jgi:hypothetical protein
MLPGRGILKAVTVWLSLAAIIASGVAQSALAADRCRDSGQTDFQMPCAASASCCCTAEGQPQACACQNQADPSSPPPAMPNLGGETAKSLPWTGAASAMPVIAPAEHSLTFPGRDSVPVAQQPSRSLLCVWRI